MTLIDVLYEKHIRVFCSADGEPSDLFANIMTMHDARNQKSKMVGLLAVYHPVCIQRVQLYIKCQGLITLRIDMSRHRLAVINASLSISGQCCPIVFVSMLLEVVQEVWAACRGQGCSLPFSAALVV